MDVEAVQVLITPGKDDLQDRVEVRQGCIAADEEVAPDQRTDVSKDHTELVDARLTHGQSVMQAPCCCKTSPRNLALSFYDPLTTGDLSLSSCIEAIIAAQIGEMENATEYGMAALLMDLADVRGNVKDGCHIVSMGGTRMMLTYGFGGLRDHDGTLSFWPRRSPEANAILCFPLTYRGRIAGGRDRSGDGDIRAA